MIERQVYPQPMRRRHLRLLPVVLMLCLSLVLGTLLWYALAYRRTPTYALNAIAEGVKNHDAETVARYVDLPAVSAEIYGDLLTDILRENPATNPQAKETIAQYYQTIQPEVIDGMKEAALLYVQKGVLTSPQGLFQGRNLGFDFEAFLERTLLSRVQVLNLESIDRDGHQATAQVAIRDMGTDTPFTLKLALTQAEDGHWQVTAIQNYKEYLDTLGPLYQKDIVQYQKASEGIVNHYNQIFQNEQARFAKLMNTKNGLFTPEEKTALHHLLTDEVMPQLKARQKALSALEVPPGARYVSQLRATSTALTLAAWERFLAGVDQDDLKAYDDAETLHKQALVIELRLAGIFHHVAVAGEENQEPPSAN